MISANNFCYLRTLSEILSHLFFTCSNLILSKCNQTLPSQILGLAALKDSLLQLFREVHSQRIQVEASGRKLKTDNELENGMKSNK